MMKRMSCAGAGVLIALLAVGSALWSPALAAKAKVPNPLAGKSLSELTTILTTSPDEVARNNAVQAIAADVSVKNRRGGRPPKNQPKYVAADAKVVAALVNGLADKASSVRYACREALGRCGAVAVGPLVKALASRNVEVRSYAADALGDMGAYDDSDDQPLDQAVPDLTKLLGDKNYAVRVSAAMALSRIGVRAAPALARLIPLLNDSEWAVADAAVRAVAAADPSGKRSVPALARALGNKKHDLREFICAELAVMGPNAEAAIPALIKLLDTDRNSWQAGKAAAGALAAIVSIDPKNPDARTVSAETRTIVLSAIAKSAADTKKVPFVQDGRLYALLPKLSRTYGPGYTGPLGAEVAPALPVALSRLQSWTIPYHHWVPRRELVAFIAEVAPQTKAKKDAIDIVQALLAHKELAPMPADRNRTAVRKDLESLLARLQAK